MPQTVLFLGASHQQLAPIQYARRAGYRVVTCDNRPDNPGHALADEWHAVSTTDRDGVLALARRIGADAIVCYASDAGAPTAAYVAQALGLPGNPLQAVETLTDKARFRALQRAHGHFLPAHVVVAAAQLADPALGERIARDVGLPAVVKPVDASGARGVAKVATAQGLAPAIADALAHSSAGRAIVERQVLPRGYQVCGEGFLVDGKLVFHAFANEHFVPGQVVPIGESFPSMFDAATVAAGADALQAVLADAGLRQGPINFDLMFADTGEVFVIEIGPRNGGNRMPEAVLESTGVDTIAATVEAALGRPVVLQAGPTRFRATYSIHSRRDGVLASIAYHPALRPHILDERLFVAPGEAVSAFTMGNRMLGNLLLAFDDYDHMLAMLDAMDDYETVGLAP
jgi:biotin carboxylase